MVYSDGVTEALDLRNELFGEDRLIGLLQGRLNQRARDLSVAVISAVASFVGSAPQADDLTLVVIRFGPA